MYTKETNISAICIIINLLHRMNYTCIKDNMGIDYMFKMCLKCTESMHYPCHNNYVFITQPTKSGQTLALSKISYTNQITLFQYVDIDMLPYSKPDR